MELFFEFEEDASKLIDGGKKKKYFLSRKI
jgi:hypothetical protein